jgi:protein-disulfide isomerase
MRVTRNFMIATAAALTLAACGGGAGGDGATSGAKAIAAPAGTSWSETTAVSSYGGFVMGNPDAPVKLAEYGAFSCSHCADFSEASKTELKALVDKGTVSYEFRPFLLGPQDIPASLLARCSGPGPFFAIAEQMFAAQRDWLGKLQTVSEEDQKRFSAMNPVQLTAALAEVTGLEAFIQQQGVPADKAKACLADAKAIDALVKMSQVGQTEFKVQGTPTFVINGSTVENTSEWSSLKPKLVEAGA